LADEASLIELSALIFEYYKRACEMGAAASVALVHVEHIYYKHSTVDEAVHKAHAFNKKWGHLSDVHPSCTSKMTTVPSGEWDSSKTHPAGYMGYPTVSVEVPDAAVALNEMCQFIFKNGDERTKTRALLCSVFHHALHDRFYKARDLFLISHIQDGIDKADTKTQILFNRVLAALGLSAFRAGLVLKAYDCLSGICSGRPLLVKELLAQGQSRWLDKDPEQERIERRRQMPYHMHINHDLLDCCYLTCAMLTELPGIARGAGYGPQAYNRPFKKYFQSYNRQVFTGPPENTREHVMAASKALLAGDWKQGTDYILGMDVWNLIPNEGGDAVKKMLSVRIREEAVRTYLLSSVVSAYSSIGMGHLCECFEMEAADVRRIVSKTIFSKELNAAWDGDTLMILKSETSTLQQLSVRAADKVNQLADSNERLLDPLNGGNMFRKDEWQDNRGGNRGKGQWQDNRGGNNQQGGNRWAKSGATGRGNYNDRNNNHQGGRNNLHNSSRGGGHHRHNNHNQDNNNNRREHHHRGDGQQQQQQQGGRGGGGFNDRSNESEKPKMAWNAVSSAA
jgi:translation initiation factor 3 subunit C